VWLRKRSVFSLRRNTGNNVADVTSSGRLFQTLGPAEANERSPTVTSRDGRMSSRLEDADKNKLCRSRPLEIVVLHTYIQTDRQMPAKTLPLRFTGNISTYGIASLHLNVSVAFNVMIIQSFNNHQISLAAFAA